MARRKRERNIFFPWERRASLWSMPWTRSRPLMAGAAMVIVLLVCGSRERAQTGRRATRAALLVTREALDAYRADHQAECPPSLATLQDEGYLGDSPTDAWGRPLQLVCPGRRNPESYDLVSFGPSGDMRGLDRVE